MRDDHESRVHNTGQKRLSKRLWPRSFPGFGTAKNKPLEKKQYVVDKEVLDELERKPASGG
jgi:hypothetical protein